MGLVGEEYLPPLTPSASRASEGCSDRHHRMLRLATLALQELSAGFSPPVAPPLMLSLPEKLSEHPDPIRSGFLSHLELQSGVKIDVARSQVFRQGRAGGLLAIQRAIELLEARHAQIVYVGGVDTYLELGLLSRLNQEGRLLTGGRTDGFIPGEGAAFLMLASSEGMRRANLAPMAHLFGVGVGTEEGHLYSERPHLGDGLADSIRALFEGLPPGGARIETVYAGMNGEHIWGKEWGVAYLRNQTFFREEYRMEHPAEFIGDPGAALGVLMVGLAAIALKKGYRHGPCLVWCGSDREERAAALVHSAQ